MTSFSEDIRKKAEACLTRNQWNPDTVSLIAQALMDERERCADSPSKQEV
jgi:hypothetical protein